MSLLLIVILLFVLFGGASVYSPGFTSGYGSVSLGTIVIIILACYALGVR